MQFCSLFKSVLCWLGVLLSILGVWTAGSDIVFGAGLSVPGSMVLPLGVVILTVSVVVNCPFKRRSGQSTPSGFRPGNTP